MDQLNFIINSTMPVHEAQDVTDSGEMKFALKKLHKRIDDMKQSQAEVGGTLSSHDIHQYAVSYILVGALALAAGALLYRWLRLRARRAHITSDMELQPTRSVSDVNVHSVSARQNISEHQSSATQHYGELSNTTVNRACPRVPRNPLGTLSS